VSGIEIVVFTKSGGPLTKQINLGGDGKINSDGSACVMSHGSARRARVDGVGALAAIVTELTSAQAIALGALRSDLPDEVGIVTKDKLNGAAGVIARTDDAITYRDGRPAFVLLDYDTKAMPADVADRIADLGGFWDALVAVLPDLRHAARVIRTSTSAGLTRIDTGEKFPGSGGMHAYIVAKNGANAGRFLSALHERCWLSGLGWYMVGAAGQLLERSIVDRMVGAAERLVFEGAAVLVPPLSQDANIRRPIVTDGDMIDTTAACAPLTPVEQQALRKLKAEAAQRLLPARNQAREEFVTRHARELIARTGMTEGKAARVIERQCGGVLLADVVLPLDDVGIVATVGNVLDDPARFEGFTLADPIEGIEYGRTKAKILRRADGAPWINSFAHGGATYELKYDARAVRTRIERADHPIDAFIKLALAAELDEIETKQFTDEVAKRAGVSVRAVTAKLKSAKNEQTSRHIEEMCERRLAERDDPRPQIPNPAADAPWLEQMNTINEVMALPRRPRRNVDGTATKMRKYPVPNTHAFTSGG
jgi:hypothetical protein